MNSINNGNLSTFHSLQSLPVNRDPARAYCAQRLYHLQRRLELGLVETAQHVVDCGEKFPLSLVRSSFRFLRGARLAPLPSRRSVFADVSKQPKGHSTLHYPSPVDENIEGCSGSEPPMTCRCELRWSKPAAEPFNKFKTYRQDRCCRT